MSIQDLINIINSQLPDNNKQLITEAILRGVLTDMVNTLSGEVRLFNIEANQVTDNGDGTYTIAVTDPLTGAMAVDENLNIYEFDGTDWTLKFDGAVISSAVQPGDNVSGLANDAGYLTETTHDALPKDNPHGVTKAQVGLGNVDNTSDLNKPVSGPQQNAINQAEADANQYTDNSISNLNLGSASQSDVGDFIAATEKGAAGGVTPLGLNQKIDPLYLPPVAINEIIEAAETTIAAFAANSGNYTFETGDVILINDSGNVQHYLYKGGTKTDVNEYSLINATQIDWNNVTGKPSFGSAALANVGDFATAGQGLKADNAVQSVNGKSGNNVTIDPDDLDDSSSSHKFVSQGEKDAIANALQPGDNISELNNDANYINYPDLILQQLYLSQEDFHLQQKYTYDTGAQDFVMDYDFQDVVDVFVNGTRLARTEYTLTYNKVTIEAALTQGDKVVINYTHRCDFDKVYGIKRDKTIASPDWERIGRDMTLHASLPVQSGMRRCVLDDNGDVVYYLDANDSSLKDDGVTPAVLDGTDGQLMVEIPRHFERFNEYDGIQYVFISTDPFPGAFMVEKMYVSTDECAIHRPSNTLASVINTTADYRGGNNQSAWDATASSMLGMAVTATSLINFNAYARNRGDGWRAMYYDVHRVIAWLITIEYATYYHQQAYNPTLTVEGYRQGGLGDGPTGINNADWTDFNGRYPLIPIGTTLSLGNNSGEVVHTIQDFPTAGNTQDITSNSYRGIANWYGHLFEWTDGIRFEASNGGVTREIFKEVGEAYSTNDTVGYKSIGFTPESNGYITEPIFGKDGDIIAKENSGGSSGTYLTDYFYMNSNDGYRGFLRSGHANYGAFAGSFLAYSAYGVTTSSSNVGSRLCFFPEKRETDA